MSGKGAGYFDIFDDQEIVLNRQIVRDELGVYDSEIDEKKHCTITARDRLVTIFDNTPFSENSAGVRVNGGKKIKASLCEGDTVQIGKLHLTVKKAK